MTVHGEIPKNIQHERLATKILQQEIASKIKTVSKSETLEPKQQTVEFHLSNTKLAIICKEMLWSITCKILGKLIVMKKR